MSLNQQIDAHKIHSGWLYKKGWYNTSWKKRFFVIYDDRTLHYFSKEEHASNRAKAKGIIHLTQIRRVEIVQFQNNQNSNSLKHSSHYLPAQSAPPTTWHNIYHRQNGNQSHHSHSHSSSSSSHSRSNSSSSSSSISSADDDYKSITAQQIVSHPLSASVPPPNVSSYLKHSNMHNDRHKDSMQSSYKDSMMEPSYKDSSMEPSYIEESIIEDSMIEESLTSMAAYTPQPPLPRHDRTATHSAAHVAHGLTLPLKSIDEQECVAAVTNLAPFVTFSKIK